ncbi:hypothetical protein [Lentzea sp. NPDC004782]|uniref:hypothetical protein n=1 Tax=Lentzea sp. NPDC004782 TaxID=3154458 RepID=UPI0033B8F683
MKKSIGVGMIISGIALFVAMATAGAAEPQPTTTQNSVVSTGAPEAAIAPPIGS